MDGRSWIFRAGRRDGLREAELMELQHYGAMERIPMDLVLCSLSMVVDVR